MLDADFASELIASGVTTQPADTVISVLAASRDGASINAAAKASGINYRTAQRIVEAAGEPRSGSSRRSADGSGHRQNGGLGEAASSWHLALWTGEPDGFDLRRREVTESGREGEECRRGLRRASCAGW